MKQSPLIKLFRSDPRPEVTALRPAAAPTPLAWLRAKVGTTIDETTGLVERFRRNGGGPRPRGYRAFLLAVVLPTLITTSYLYLVAADQYVTEAHFFVAGPSQPQTQAGSGGTQLLGGSATSSGAETLAVLDFMQSHDAVGGLGKRLDLAAIYRRPEADFVARLIAEPTAERLRDYLFYFPHMISASLDFTTGVGVLKVRAFRADDAREVAESLLQLGDQLVQRFSARAEQDALRVARDEVGRAEERVATAQQKITEFRLQQQALDPGKSGGTILDVIGKLEGDLAQTSAELAASRTYLKPDNPRILELTTRIAALEAQVKAEKSRLTGPDGALAPTLAAYERLLLEREFADKDYNSALTSLEAARVQAERQHLYLVRVVEPNLADDSEYPKRFLAVLTVFVGLTVAYGIGWLIVAGIREHTG